MVAAPLRSTDEQYQAILDTLDDRAEAIRKGVDGPLEAEKKLADNERLRTLIELGRWGAMALGGRRLLQEVGLDRAEPPIQAG